MRPDELRPEQFNNWPPVARQIATARVALLRKLPLGFIPLLFRELIAYDWKFPAERRELDRQFQYLETLSPGRMQNAMRRFTELHLTPALEQLDWVNRPAQFSEQLAAHLWTTHQIDSFRTAATDYIQDFNQAVPDQVLPLPRAGIVLIGKGLGASRYRLFRRLRKHGAYFTGIQPQAGFRAILDAAATRAAAHPAPYGHWYIDGGAVETNLPDGLACLSYSGLEPVRAVLGARMRAGYDSRIGPEALRDVLTAMRPSQVGLTSGDGVFNRFVLSLFTEGSGTQVFSTTFVQWATREVLRRAQPLTLVARFAPRVREQSMDRLLTSNPQTQPTDPEGSLIDADMGAWYAWLNQQRLPGAEQSSFLVWFENHQEALAVGPSFSPGTESSGRIDLAELVGRIV
jgi:hypothetical protein